MIVSASVDPVLSAISHPRRRALFERVGSGDGLSVAELTSGSGITQGAVSQHLKVLREAGLVSSSPHGRRVIYRAVPDALTPLADWLAGYERFWSDRLESLRQLVAELEE